MRITFASRPSLLVQPSRVDFADITDETNDDLRSAAYVATRERPENCFGANVTRYGDGTATVLIYRD